MNSEYSRPRLKIKNNLLSWLTNQAEQEGKGISEKINELLAEAMIEEEKDERA